MIRDVILSETEYGGISQMIYTADRSIMEAILGICRSKEIVGICTQPMFIVEM
jgi:hypothetical protein